MAPLRVGVVGACACAGAAGAGVAGLPGPGSEGSDCCCAKAGGVRSARATVTKATGFTDSSIALGRCKCRSGTPPGPLAGEAPAERAIVWYKVRDMSDQHVAGTKSFGGAASPQDDEPKTPIWLTAVGAALFVGVALWWAVTPAAAPSTPAEAAPSASVAGAAAAPNPQAQAQPPAQQRPAAPGASAQQARFPAPSALPADVQKRLNELRGKPHP